MQDLVFSAEDIFNSNSDNGCLFQYEAEKFLIPTYQRGYKWGSQAETDAVPTLLKDLWIAFNSAQTQKHKREYYLQYITVKKVGNCLEVIDGQQRLTTLSILFSILPLHLETQNIASGKLAYSIRESFFTEHIYQKTQLTELLNATWNSETGLAVGQKTFNTQDVFYLFHAAKRINNFLSQDEVKNKLNDFESFLRRDIKIIVNAVESYVPSERVFNNLNSSKVPLTEVDLIKALFITKLARIETLEQKKHYKEILEARSLLGKHWDEIAAQTREPEFGSFFFGEEPGMESLLELVAKKFGYTPPKNEKKENKNYPLFNFFNAREDKLVEYFDRIKLSFSVLKEWHRTDYIYNLLGFIFFAKTSKINKSEFINSNLLSAKKDLEFELLKRRKELLSKDIATSKYGDDEIHNALLAMSVFDDSTSETIRFNYYSFKEDSWSLEHIFPQRPEGKATLNAKQRLLVLEMLGGANATPRMKELLAKAERTPEEKEEYYKELQAKKELNSIGNMALLSSKDNSSNGCGFFEQKRTNILKRIKKGSFVPKHTFDVFSKMIFPSNPGDLLLWSKENIDNHEKVFQDFITYLNQQQTNEVGEVHA